MESESHEGFLMVYLVIFCLSALLALALFVAVQEQ